MGRSYHAIYHRFETDFCAHEVQAMYFEYLEGLVEAAESGTTAALKLAHVRDRASSRTPDRSGSSGRNALTGPPEEREDLRLAD